MRVVAAFPHGKIELSILECLQLGLRDADFVRQLAVTTLSPKLMQASCRMPEAHGGSGQLFCEQR